MANSPLVQIWQGQMGIAKESAWGTYVAPSSTAQFVRLKQAKVEDVIDDIPDESYQGVRSKTQNFYQGFRYAKVTADFFVDQLSVGQFFMAFFGTDTKTGVSDPVTHKFSENDATPPSYTLSNYDATIATTRAIEGAYLQKLSVNYAEKGAVMAQATFLGKYTDVGQTKPTATYDTANLYVPWMNALTLNGSSNAHLIGMKLDFDQEIQPVFGAGGTQDVTAFSTGTIAITGELTFAPIDATEIQLYRGNTQGIFNTTFTNGTHSLNFTFTKCAFKNGTVLDQNSPYAKVVAKIEGIRNATDVGPGTVTLINALTTAY